MRLERKIQKLLANGGVSPTALEKSAGESLAIIEEISLAQGLRLRTRGGLYFYDTVMRQLDDTVFCIVDIETNGSKPAKHQIIEIGAVKVKNRTIIDTFESLVQCDTISEHITEITGIHPEMTEHAPALPAVLEAFKLFLGDCVFVAHDVKFDYGFISAMLERCGLLPLMNRSLCTIDLAERTIASYRYGLSYLNEQLELYEDATHHRALSDAITTAKLFKRTLNHIPETIKTAEDLIRFSKEGKRLKRLSEPSKAEE